MFFYGMMLIVGEWDMKKITIENMDGTMEEVDLVNSFDVKDINNVSYKGWLTFKVCIAVSPFGTYT